MEKAQFFDNLHRQLADKHCISPSAIDFLRDLIVGKKQTKEQIIQSIQDRSKKILASIYLDQQKIAERKTYRLTNPKFNQTNQSKIRNAESNIERSLNSLKLRNEVSNFLKSITIEQWQDISQKTEFDK